MLNTVIFDMDGLLIDSEPLWQEAATETFAQYKILLTHEQYITTTGLRTREFVRYWFEKFGVDAALADTAEKTILGKVITKIEEKGKVMPGVSYIFSFFKQMGFKIGLASSSPMDMIEEVTTRIGVHDYIQAATSAESLLHGKPHPQVYLNCALALNSEPSQCICFEDSFNGMIAVKAARMKCVIVPAYSQYKSEKWGAADLKISSLQNFNNLHLQLLDRD